ncbi:MOB kinase activator-like 1A protein [Tanacetum coccineum]
MFEKSSEPQNLSNLFVYQYRIHIVPTGGHRQATSRGHDAANGSVNGKKWNQKGLFGSGDSNMSILIGQKPIVVSDPKYVNYLMEWIETQLDNESIFPQKLGKIQNGELIGSKPSRPPVTFMHVNGADCCSIAKLKMYRRFNEYKIRNFHGIQIPDKGSVKAVRLHDQDTRHVMQTGEINNDSS